MPDTLTTQELKILFIFLEKQYLPYDNFELHDVVRKIQRIIGTEEEGNVMVERGSPRP